MEAAPDGCTPVGIQREPGGYDRALPGLTSVWSTWPARSGALEVVAFFPQGIDEDNLDWLFPDISNRTIIFDTFYLLSLTYKNGGFTTTLAPLRDYLRLHDPTLSPLLCATKGRYCTRMSIHFDRNKPSFKESRWILSEDVNVEHLLGVFASIDPNSNELWRACSNFVQHLCWHKPRLTFLRQKIEDLPDDHQCKPKCLAELAELFMSIGHHEERKRTLNQTLQLVGEEGGRKFVARILSQLSDANRILGLRKEGIQQAREALEIYQQLGSTVEQPRCLIYLARLLLGDKQPDAAKEAASHAIELLPQEGWEFTACQSQRILGKVCRSKGERDKAIHHYEAALAIASPFDWDDQLLWIHHALARLFLDEGEFDHANTHIERAKSHAANDDHGLGCATELQAKILFRQRRLQEAKSEALRAFEVHEKLGAAKG